MMGSNVLKCIVSVVVCVLSSSAQAQSIVRPVVRGRISPEPQRLGAFAFCYDFRVSVQSEDISPNGEFEIECPSATATLAIVYNGGLFLYNPTAAEVASHNPGTTLFIEDRSHFLQREQVDCESYSEYEVQMNVGSLQTWKLPAGATYDTDYTNPHISETDAAIKALEAAADAIRSETCVGRTFFGLPGTSDLLLSILRNSSNSALARTTSKRLLLTPIFHWLASNGRDITESVRRSATSAGADLPDDDELLLEASYALDSAKDCSTAFALLERLSPAKREVIRDNARIYYALYRAAECQGRFRDAFEYLRIYDYLIPDQQLIRNKLAELRYKAENAETAGREKHEAEQANIAQRRRRIAGEWYGSYEISITESARVEVIFALYPVSGTAVGTYDVGSGELHAAGDMILDDSTKDALAACHITTAHIAAMRKLAPDISVDLILSDDGRRFSGRLHYEKLDPSRCRLDGMTERVSFTRSW